ncbi:NUDIX hydrolase [Halobacteriovorax marinus]|uniref:NUDIX hydrolase n=1 Tax=Halobacteriovorax marinus TaxID=97084 RepID=UPI003A94AB4F
MLKKWKTLEYRQILKSFVFSYYTAKRESGEMRGDFDVLECRNWINVIALDQSGNFILVKQYRHGIDDLTLESVGGVVESGEDTLVAAKRELLEETGHESEDWTHLGRASANPAFMNNYCDYYLAKNCQKTSEQNLDPLEEIEVLKMNEVELFEKIKSGEIHHSLFLAGLGLLKIS